MSSRIKLFAVVVAVVLPLGSAFAESQGDAAAEPSNTNSLGQRLSRLGRTLFQRPAPENQAQSPGRSRQPSSGMASMPATKQPRAATPEQNLRPNPQPIQTQPPAGGVTAPASSRRTAQPTYGRGQQAQQPARSEAPRVAERVTTPPTSPPASAKVDTSQSLETTATQADAQPRTETSSPVAGESLETTPEAKSSEPSAEPDTPSDSNGTKLPANDRQGSLQNRLRAARRMTNETDTSATSSQAVSGKESSSDINTAPIGKKPLSKLEPSKTSLATGADSPRDSADTVAETSRSPLLSHEAPVLHLETIGPQKIKVGMPAVYKVKLRNSANCEAADVVVSVKVPEGADIANSEASEGSTQPGAAADGAATIEWKIPKLAGKGHAELSIRMIPRKNRPFDLAVQWSHAPVVSQTQVEVQEAKLLMNLSGPNEVFYGEREVFKLTLSNPGNGDAEHVMVRLMPTTPGDGQAVSHEIGVIRAGENKVVELELTARQVGTLRMKAEATADSGLQAAIDEEIVVRRADLKVVVDGPQLLYAGTTGTFKVHVSNPGTAMAKNVQIGAVLPAGATYVSSSEGGVFAQDQARIAWTTTNLRPGGDWSCTFTCELANPGANTTQVVGSADGDLRNTASFNTLVEALADLTLEVKDPQGPVPVGQETWYEVQVRNRGTKAAEGVEIFAFFSPGVEPISVDGGPHEISPGQIALAPIASLGPGQQVVFKIKARADRSGNHIFRAEVQCATLETKLAAEETTRFYGSGNTSESGSDNPSADAAPADAAPAETPPSETEPAPIDEASDSSEPGETTP